MPTTNFNIADVPLVYPATVTPSDNGTYIFFSDTENGQLEFAFDVFGTDATANLYTDGKISVDGGAFNTFSNGGFAQTTLFTGLTDAWHRVVIKSLYINDTNTVVATSPTTPAVRSALSWYGTSYRFLAPATVAAMKAEGAWYESPDSFDALRSGGYWGGGLTFKTSAGATGCRIYGYDAQNFDVYVDGVFHSTASLSLAWNSADVVTGLTPGAHTIELRRKDSSRGDMYLAALQIIGGTLDTSYVPDYGQVVMAVGDSITQNSNSDTPGSATAFIADLAASLGFNASNGGLQGALTPTTDAVPNAVLRSPVSDLIVYYGTNDVLQGHSAATYQSQFQAFLQKLLDGTARHAGLRTTTGTQKVLVLLPFPYVVNLDAAYTAAANAAIAALTLPANAPTIVAVDTSTVPPWPDSGTEHPTNAQNVAIATALSAYILPPDTTYPTAPGTPTVTKAVETISVTLTATESTDEDNDSSALRYRAKRDGSTVQDNLSASGGVVAHTLTGITADDTSHDYLIEAFDPAGNVTDSTAVTVVHSVAGSSIARRPVSRGR